jgi:hypothetical protein
VLLLHLPLAEARLQPPLKRQAAQIHCHPLQLNNRNFRVRIDRIVKQFIHRRKGGIKNDLWQMDIEARLTCFAFILAPCLLHNLVTVASFGSTLSLAAVCQFLNLGTPSEAIVIDRGFWFYQTLALLENWSDFRATEGFVTWLIRIPLVFRSLTLLRE